MGTVLEWASNGVNIELRTEGEVLLTDPLISQLGAVLNALAAGAGIEEYKVLHTTGTQFSSSFVAGTGQTVSQVLLVPGTEPPMFTYTASGYLTRTLTTLHADVRDVVFELITRYQLTKLEAHIV